MSTRGLHKTASYERLILCCKSHVITYSCYLIICKHQDRWSSCHQPCCEWVFNDAAKRMIKWALEMCTKWSRKLEDKDNTKLSAAVFIWARNRHRVFLERWVIVAIFSNSYWNFQPSRFLVSYNVIFRVGSTWLTLLPLQILRTYDNPYPRRLRRFKVSVSPLPACCAFSNQRMISWNKRKFSRTLLLW